MTRRIGDNQTLHIHSNVQKQEATLSQSGKSPESAQLANLDIQKGMKITTLAAQNSKVITASTVYAVPAGRSIDHVSLNGADGAKRQSQ